MANLPPPQPIGKPRDPLASAGPAVKALLSPDYPYLGPPGRHTPPCPETQGTQRRRDTDDTGTQRLRDAETQGTQRHRDTSIAYGSSVSSVSPVSHASPVSPPPPNGDFLAAALETAQHSLPPEQAEPYHLDGLRLLVALCAELQRQAGAAPFFLGCRDTGRLLGVPFQRAAKWLRRLVYDGVLQRVSVGSKGTGKASEYRYHGGAV